MHPVADLSGAAAPAPADPAPMAIIGCGNLNRSDDGVGVRVIHRLREKWGTEPPPQVRLFDAGTGGMEVMFQARGARALVIVDACRSGSEPGAVFRLPGDDIASEHRPSYSLHDFRWDHAVYAGRRIFGAAFPADLTVYLVEAAELALGTELSAAVAGAVEEVCEQIEAQVRQWCRANASGHSASIGDGRVLLARATCERFLSGASGAALLAREGRVYLVPLHEPSAGGMLLKQRNARGDRVLLAEEFLGERGLGRFAPERNFDLRWIEEAGALLIEGLA